jgi:dTDP-glucose 4,6-dehydratase
MSSRKLKFPTFFPKTVYTGKSIMNLLITGGAGFIGSALIRWLLSDEARAEREGLKLRCVVNLDAMTYAGNPANLDSVRGHPLYRFVKGNITDGALVERVFREYDITSVIHLAAESHVDRSIDDPGQFIKTNVEGTYRLLDTARRLWPRGTGRRFLHVSTDEVFGALEPEDPPFSEATPYAPNSPYAASKAAGDHLARAYFQTYGLPVLTSNCSNNYGPHQMPEKLIPLMILNALEGKSLPIYGDGRQIRDWLYVEDHVRALVAALIHGTPGAVYTLGGGNELTNLALVRMLCAGLETRQPRAQGRYEDLITFVQDRPGHDRRYAIDAVKARRELGWSPRETMAGGLDRTLDWYLANRAWCDAITEGTYARERLGMLSPAADGRP